MKALLLIIDFINDIVHPEGKISHAAERIKNNKTMQHANQAITWARKHNILIAHIKVGFDTAYINCPENSPMFSGAKQHGALKLGEWGTEFHEKMDVQPQDSIIIKHRVNAFYNTDIETLLHAQHIDTIIICGVTTNYAVEHTARDAHDREYNVVIIADACEAVNQNAHDATLASLSRFSKIINASDLNDII